MAKVQAAQTVVGAARTGIGHWTEHVQARTDLLSGKNSAVKTGAIWKRTRLAGPADQTTYDKATAAYTKADIPGACNHLPTETADAGGCSQRMSALSSAMSAGKNGMADWDSHLRAMADHAAGKFGRQHAQMLWVSTYQAAPKNISAFERADRALTDAPACG